MRRRLSNRWSMRVELIANVDVDPEDITYDARRDSFLPFDFNYNFWREGEADVWPTGIEPDSSMKT